MKKMTFLTAILLNLIIVSAQQTRKTDITDAKDRYANIETDVAKQNTGSKLPQGTYFNKGKIIVKKNYRTAYTDNRQVLLIRKKNGEVTGAFRCRYEAGSQGSCPVSISNGNLTCVVTEGASCTLDVVIKPAREIAITHSGSNWEKVIIPAVHKQQQRTEDPDQGGEVINSKKTAPPKRQ